MPDRIRTCDLTQGFALLTLRGIRRLCRLNVLRT